MEPITEAEFADEEKQRIDVLTDTDDTKEGEDSRMTMEKEEDHEKEEGHKKD